jgi:hypothetical protein
MKKIKKNYYKLLGYEIKEEKFYIIISKNDNQYILSKNYIKLIKEPISNIIYGILQLDIFIITISDKIYSYDGYFFNDKTYEFFKYNNHFFERKFPHIISNTTDILNTEKNKIGYFSKDDQLFKYIGYHIIRYQEIHNWINLTYQITDSNFNLLSNQLFKHRLDLNYNIISYYNDNYIFFYDFNTDKYYEILNDNNRTESELILSYLKNKIKIDKLNEII